MDLDDHVCLCFRVSRRKLLQYARRERPRVASQLSECGGAGTGCGWCVPFLRRLFEAESQAANPGTIDGQWLLLSSEEYRQARGVYVQKGRGTPPNNSVEKEPDASPTPPDPEFPPETASSDPVSD